MASKHWKSALLLVTTFPFLLALQLEAVWIMTNPEHRLELPTWDHGKTTAVNLASTPSVTPAATTSANTLSPTRRYIPLRRDKSAAQAPRKVGTKTAPPLTPWWNSPSLNDKQTEIESLPELLMAGIPAAAIPHQLEAQSADAPVQSDEMQEPAWLQTRDPKRYTLQLYRSRDLEGLKEFANNQLLPQPLVYYRSSSKTGSFYFLVAGDYPDMQSAKAALVELTTQLPGLKPWIRDFGKLQAQLR